MSQFQVLQCSSCGMFQVDAVKKSVKWSCKICGEKQSIKKIFSKGNGKDCRLHVQELNEIRIKLEVERSFRGKPEVIHQDLYSKEDEEKLSQFTKSYNENLRVGEQMDNKEFLIENKKSKWDIYQQEGELDNLETKKMPFTNEIRIKLEDERSFRGKPEVIHQDLNAKEDEENLSQFTKSYNENLRVGEQMDNREFLIENKKSKWDIYQEGELDNLETKKMPFTESLIGFLNCTSDSSKNECIDYNKFKNITQSEDKDLKYYKIRKREERNNDLTNITEDAGHVDQTLVSDSVGDEKMPILKKLKLCDYNQDNSSTNSISKQQVHCKFIPGSNIFENNESEDLDCLLQI